MVVRTQTPFKKRQPGDAMAVRQPGNGAVVELPGEGAAALAELTLSTDTRTSLKERDALLPGRLIVIEGTDSVGRSTQLRLLRPWLESSGYAVMATETTSSELVGLDLKEAKENHKPGSITLNLFYATDFVDRLERQILPALRAGFIVLTDRYIYSLIARALVRGADPTWIRSIYSLALQPDAVFYLRATLDDLIPRVLQRGGFDYWESGMDLHLGDDLYESYVAYQTRLLGQFEQLAREYHFQALDASQPIQLLQQQIRERIYPLLPTA